MFPHLTSWRSWFLLFVSCCILNHADGIRWLVVPHEHKNVQQGLSFSLPWHYEMDENEIFLSSEIGQKEKQNAMASRYKREDMYYKDQMDYHDSFSIFGKKNVTLIVHSAKIGQNITYCCVVKWRTVLGKSSKMKEDRRCSEVFVYDGPRITYLTPQLSSKQGDAIKLQCNATGFPTPHVEWIHDDTHKLIDSSSDTVLNITGKRSEGRYCCDANNGFGRKKGCTSVNVTEYEPWNTILLVRQINRDDINILHIKCDADASPPANYFIIKIDDKEYNSSYGLKTYKVPSPRKDKMEDIPVSCIPGNKYGQGPVKEVFLLLYVLPRFMTPLRTQYNMTVSDITLKCNATGIPTPNITWTNGDTEDIAGTGKYYQVPYVKCATITITFYCHARNAVGNISSPGIHVNVMTAHICSNSDKGLILIGCVVGGLVIGVIIALLITIWWRRKNKPRKCIFSRCARERRDAESTDFQDPIDAVSVPGRDPFQEPLDAVVPERDGSQSLLTRSNTTSTDDGYATIKDCVLRPRKQNASIPTQHERHMEDIPYQEPMDAVLPALDETAPAVTSSNATVEEYVLTSRLDATPHPREENSKFQSLTQFVTPEI